MASLVGLSCCLLNAQQPLASPETKKANAQGHGSAAAGRNLFNGKGICHYCHGIDGYRDKPPQLASDTVALIAQLNPPPADLRRPQTLRLKSDKARAKAITDGHPGTGMFPTTTLTDQELTDTLSYLAALRQEGHTSGDVGSSRATQRTDSGDSDLSVGNSKRGDELYQSSCVVCHGPRATGGVGPRLAGNPVLSNNQAFWKVVHEGRHVMPPLKGVVTDQQIVDIRAWLKTLP